MRADYHAFCEAFDPHAIAATFAGDLAAGINACVECCDRHVGTNRVALIWENAAGESGSVTFEELQARSAQVANLLVAHGVQPGDRVAGLLPRTPELVALILGVFRAGAVYQPLFTAFGPKAISHRLEISEAKVVVTDLANRPKLDELDNPPLIMCSESGGTDIAFSAATDAQSDQFDPVLRVGNDPLLMMFTSGTTGPPKGMKIPLRALVANVVYMRYALDLRDDDVFWNIADPGWAYGLYHGVIGPLLLGHQTLLYDGPFTVESNAAIVSKFGVTNYTGAPTAYRMIIGQGVEAAKPLAANLRIASSAGEPLNPEVVRWFKQ
ncbi:MAG: AMP-binding protein, partial [Gammaproteobacteria bacterium]|nr:AMP-binding protein [Gammaproteobacteria bacterium]